MSARAKTIISDLLAEAEIGVNGSGHERHPWDITVHDERFYDRVLAQGSMGLGESYMDGWWDCENLDQFIARVHHFGLPNALPIDPGVALAWLRSNMLNLQRSRAFEVGEKHYDIGNDLYEAMLDPRMIYSCGYWSGGAETLAAAQEAKLDLICRKIGLAPGMRVLDIGSGWGGFLRFAAERHGVSGVGVTISREQAAWANAHAGGLPIETRLTDYHQLDGQFDRIVSIGMFEHVGYKNYAAFFRKARELITPDGLMLLHTIGGDRTQNYGDPWVQKYIFPHGMLPSIRQIGSAIEGRFIMEDWHNFGADYDRTLLAWYDAFASAWPRLAATHDERFRRMWSFYLKSFAGTFRVRMLQLWQIVLSPKGVPGGYRSIR